ncbi:hypothetical protein HMPREF1979_01055, partial [Actinomyces johnsonii F0542]
MTEMTQQPRPPLSQVAHEGDAMPVQGLTSMAGGTRSAVATVV